MAPSSILSCLASVLFTVVDGAIVDFDYSNGYLTIDYECTAHDEVLTVEEVHGVVSNDQHIGMVSIHTCQNKCSQSATNNQACNYNGHQKDSTGIVLADDQMFSVECWCSGSCPHAYSDSHGHSVCAATGHSGMEDPNAFCGDEALLQKLCTAVPGCFGVRMAKNDKHRGYLLNDKCRDSFWRGSETTLSSSVWKHLARQLTSTSTGEGVCALGRTASAVLSPETWGNLNLDHMIFSENSASGLNFEYVSEDQTFEIRWDCGFEIGRMDVSQSATQIAATKCAELNSGECGDDVEFMNYLFGHRSSDDRYDLSICASSKTMLYEGYCQNPLFAFGCAGVCDYYQECSNCGGAIDHVEAAQVLANMHGIQISNTAAVCNEMDAFLALEGQQMCQQIAFHKVCGHVCQHYAAPDIHSRRLDDRSFRFIPGRFSKILDETRSVRRLDQPYFSPIAVSWNPATMVREVDTCNMPFEYERSSELYDMVSFLAPVPDVKITQECNPQQRFRFASTKCTASNIALQNLPQGDLKQHILSNKCSTKCKAATTLTNNEQDITCTGAVGTMTDSSNALCMLMEDVLALASELTSVLGYEFVAELDKSLPRAYLKSADCVEEAISSTEDLTSDVMLVYSALDFDTQVSYNYCDNRKPDSDSYISASDLGYEWDAFECSMESGCSGTQSAATAMCDLDIECAGIVYYSSIFRFHVLEVFQFSGCASLGEYDSSNGPHFTMFKVVADSSDDSVGTVDRWNIPCNARVTSALADDGFAAVDGLYTYVSPSSAHWKQLCEVCVDGDHTKDQMFSCYKNEVTGHLLKYSEDPCFSDESYKPWMCTDESSAQHLSGKNWVLKAPGASPILATSVHPIGQQICLSRDNDVSYQNVYIPSSGFVDIFRWSPEQITESWVEVACHEYSLCPILTACALSGPRFEREIMHVYGGFCGLDVNVDQTWTPLELLPSETKNTILSEDCYQPKVLTTADRAEMLIVNSKRQWSGQVQRNHHGSTLVEVVDIQPAIADKVIITIAPQGTYGQFETGDGHVDFLSDVITVQAFDTKGEPIPSVDANENPVLDITLRVYQQSFEGSEKIKFFKYDFSSCIGQTSCKADHAGPAQIEGSDDKDGFRHGVPVSAVGEADGYVLVTIRSNGYYMATMEKSCQASELSSSEIFSYNGVRGFLFSHTDPGSLAVPLCLEEFAVVSHNLQCVEGEWLYLDSTESLSEYVACDSSCFLCASNSKSHGDTYFMLTHRSRMDYGWRIAEIQAFSDPCSSVDLETGVDEVSLTDVSIESGGEYPNFPSSNLHDSQMDTEWWSAGLNVNPIETDETHGGAVRISFMTTTSDVKCVKVYSRASDGSRLKQYYPTEVVLYRGVTDADMQPCKQSITDVEGFTEMWKLVHSDSDSGNGDGMFTTERNDTNTAYAVAHFSTVCGQSTPISGELVTKIDSDTDSKMQTSCDCKQRALDAASSGTGVISWKFTTTDGTSQCHLMKSINEAEECATTIDDGWLYGTTGLRLLSASPTVVAGSSEFSLQVSGINLPSDFLNTHSTTANRQRIKIVAENVMCAQGDIPKTVSGIKCANKLFCSPLPSSSSPEMVEFGPLMITPMPSQVNYKICYNRGNTFDLWDWHEVPGFISVSQQVYSFVSDPAVVMRTTEKVSITVSKIPWADYTEPAHWRLKIIDEKLSCDLLTDEFIQAPTAACQGSILGCQAFSTTDNDAVFSDWTIYAPTIEAATNQQANVGTYKVCFSNDQGATFFPVPNANGQDLHLEIEAEEGYSTRVYGIFGEHMFSASATETTIQLSGYQLPLPSYSAVRLCANSCAACGDDAIQGSVDNTVSTPSLYSILLNLHEASSEYMVCYCNGADTSHQVDDDSSVMFQQNLKTHVGQDNFMWFGVLPAEVQAVECYTQCSKGCKGPNCDCGEFDATTMDEPADNFAAPLCGGVVVLTQLCELHDGCAGVQMLSSNLGYFVKHDFDLDIMVYDENREFFQKINKVACSQPENFDREVGTLVVTERVEVNSQWVLQPDSAQSIEVLGEGLSIDKDRIMIIDCTGTCGISDAADAILAPEYRDQAGYIQTPTNAEQRQQAFNLWVPVSVDIDSPSSNQDVGWKPTTTSVSVTLEWNTLSGNYCLGNTIHFSEMSNVMQAEQCYAKFANSITATDSVGYVGGVDTAESPAVCPTDIPAAKNLCLQTKNCIAFATDPLTMRTFFYYHNATDPNHCHAQISSNSLGIADHYDLYYLKLDSFEEKVNAASSTIDVAEATISTVDGDAGYSWPQLLRFRYVKFRSGGSFKVCFCDHELLSSGRICKAVSDYKVTIGDLHVSGVECLVSQSRFQRGTCVMQRWGGLRCYEGQAPSLTPVDQNAEAPASIVTEQMSNVLQESVLSTLCQVGSEEHSLSSAICASY